MNPTKPFRSSFAQRFDFARRRHEYATGEKINDKTLASRIGMSASWASLVKNEGLTPDNEQTVAIAEVFHVDPGWLGFGDASEAPAPAGWTDEVERLRATEAAPKKRRGA